MSQRKFARVPSPLTPLAAAAHGHFVRAPGDDLHHFQRRQGRKLSDQLEQSQSTLTFLLRCSAEISERSTADMSPFVTA